jgi:hypothetical protein
MAYEYENSTEEESLDNVAIENTNEAEMDMLSIPASNTNYEEDELITLDPADLVEEKPKKKVKAVKSKKPAVAPPVVGFGKIPTSPFNVPQEPYSIQSDKTKIVKPINVKTKEEEGYKYDKRGYLVPKSTKESTLWDDTKDFVKDLFSDSAEENNGKLTYYEQTPIKEQQVKFKKESRDAMDATGKFEFLKEYSGEDRALFVSKLVPKTNYTEKKYNQETNQYDVVITRRYRGGY